MHMFDVFCLSVALAVGQGGPTTAQPIPPAAAPGRAAIGDDLPRRIPPALPAVGVPGPAPARPVAQDTTPSDPAAPAAKNGEPKNGEPKNGDAEKKNGDEEKKDEEKKEPEKGHFMKLVEGTPLGAKLEAKKIKVDG